MRELFLSRLIELIDRKLISFEVFSKNKYDQLVNDIKKIKDKSSKGCNDNILLIKYNVVTEDNVEKLVMPSIVGHHKYYVYEEQLYDIISKMHIDLKHAKLPELFNALRMKYVNIPIEIIQLFLSLCHVCSSQESTLKDLNGLKSVSQQFNPIRQDKDLSHPIKYVQIDSIEMDEVPVIDISDDEDDNDIEKSRVTFCQDQTDVCDKNEVVEDEEEISVLEEISNNCVSDLLNCVPTSELPNFSRVSESVSRHSKVESNVIRKEHNRSELSNESFTSIEDSVYEEDDNEIVGPTEVCLRWNLYDRNMKSILSNFLYNEQFVDVSLACENKTIKCHKVILAASSPYFENLFKQNTYRHPVIVLKDVYFWEIQALIEFIYTGEVKIPRHKLESLMDAANSLQIKGLAEPVNDKTSVKNVVPHRSILKKKFSVKCKQEKKFVFKNIQNSNKKLSPSKKAVTKSEIGIQTSPDINGTIHSNVSLSSNAPQVPDSVPNLYRVFTQTYIPVTNSTSCQNFIPADHSSGNVASFSVPHISCPSIPQSIPIPYTAVPVTLTPDTTNLVPQMNFQKSSNHSFTVSCCSSTQTSPTNVNNIDGQDISSASTSQEMNLNNKNLNDKSTKKKKSSKRDDEVINSKINSLISRGETNVIFTRKKAADAAESVAKRTRKKQSEKNKKRSKYSDLFIE